MADVSTQIKFLYGSKSGIEGKIADNTIEGSDLVITSDTDELVFVDKAKNIKPIKSRTENEYTLVGTDIGALPAGSKIDPGITLDQFIAMICQKRIAATYTAPTVSLTRTGGITNGGTYELGSTQTLTASSAFTKNDAGVLTAININLDGVAIATGTASPLSLSAHEFTVGAASMVFQAQATYAQGDVKNDNLGDPSPAGRIEAGTVSSSKITVYGKRYAFYGAGTGTAAITDSAAVRGLSNSKAAGKGTISIPLSVGQQFVAFAVPSTQSVTKVRYEEGNDDAMLPNFTKTTVSVEGANGFTAIDYHVYVYQMASAAEAGMNFTVTLG